MIVFFSQFPQQEWKRVISGLLKQWHYAHVKFYHFNDGHVLFLANVFPICYKKGQKERYV